jgi:hypothetical protein
MRRQKLCPGSWLSRFLVVLLLLFLFAQLVFSVILKSPTIDEPNHLTRGYAYLKTGDLRLSRVAGHPPLFNLLCSLPLVLVRDLKLPLQHPSWQAGFRNAFVTEFIFGGDVPVSRVFFLGRLVVMMTTVCLAALVARWARELYGPWGGIVSLLLVVLDPNLIAHGRLVTTDVGVTFFFTLTTYLFWRFLRRPSWPLLLASGLALGMALGVKFSAIILLPVLGLLGLIAVADPGSSLGSPWPSSRGGYGVPRQERRFETRGTSLPGGLRFTGPRLWALSVAVAVVVCVAGLTVWAIYAFEVGQPEGWDLAVPAPTYVQGLWDTLVHASSGHPAFLMGQRASHGWWYYFPVVFALKTPLPALIVLLGAVLSNVWKRTMRVEWPLLLIPAIYFGLSMRSALNIGYRHLLPMLPLLWIYVGRLVGLVQGTASVRRRRWAVAASALLLSWLAIGTLGIAPDYLAYFNEIAGGPQGGWRYLVDSNLDWGQDLPALKAYVDRSAVEPVYLSWFGSTYPHLYGLDLEYRLLPSHFSYPYPGEEARSPYNPLYPAPGLYVIGATNLQGDGLTVGDVFAGFRERKEIARLGHSLFVYQISDSGSSPNPTCVSGFRLKDLADETVAWTYGRGPGPIKWFDHSTSFVMPGVGDAVYVLPDVPLSFLPDLQAAFLSRAAVVARQEPGGRSGSDARIPAAIVYQVDRAAADAWKAEALSTIGDASLAWSPSASLVAAEIHPLAAPVFFDYGLELLGYRMLSGPTVAPGGVIELVTVWRVTSEVPAAAADLRVFAHLLDRESRVWAAQDRLDVDPPAWEPGDLFMQLHRLALAPGTPEGTYPLEIGLYTAITMRRLGVRVDGVPVADRVLLPSVEVAAP